MQKILKKITTFVILKSVLILSPIILKLKNIYLILIINILFNYYIIIIFIRLILFSIPIKIQNFITLKRLTSKINTKPKKNKNYLLLQQKKIILFSSLIIKTPKKNANYVILKPVLIHIPTISKPKNIYSNNSNKKV